MGKNNPTVFNTRDKKDVLITNFPEHSPIIRFDGAGGLSMNRVVRVEIKGLEIIGTYIRILAWFHFQDILPIYIKLTLCH